MKPSRLPIILLCALLAGAAAAQSPPSKSYSPGPFDSLQLAGSAQVQYRQGERDEVIVEGDEAMQRQVELLLRGSRLTVRTQSSWWSWSKPRVQLQIVSRELKELGISGAADFIAAEPVKAAELNVVISGAGLARFDQLRSERLRFAVSGAGDGHFAGQVEELRISISGKGEVQAEQLAAERVQIGISGLGKAKIWAIKDLTVSTSGIGTVDYWGSPALSRRSSGVSTINGLGAKAAPAAP